MTLGKWKQFFLTFPILPYLLLFQPVSTFVSSLFYLHLISVLLHYVNVNIQHEKKKKKPFSHNTNITNNPGWPWESGSNFCWPFQHYHTYFNSDLYLLLFLLYSIFISRLVFLSFCPDGFPLKNKMNKLPNISNNPGWPWESGQKFFLTFKTLPYLLWFQTVSTSCHF